jgi:hypothetical protein
LIKTRGWGVLPRGCGKVTAACRDGQIRGGQIRLLLGALLLAMIFGCAYDPPMRADHASAKYQADLGACRPVAHKEADRVVKARGPLFLTYPISLPIERRIQMRKCMQGKGYKLED